MPYASRLARNAYARDYVNAKRATRRAVAIAYLGGVCARCGGKDQLEFHHKDQSRKVNNIGDLWTASAKKLWAELDKCELLCHECHFKVTYYGDDKGGHV